MSWRFSVLIAVGLLIAGLLVGWQLSPRINGVFPPEGEIQGRQSLTIQFNRNMDGESVEERFEVIPTYEGEISWDEEGNKMTFTPKNIWPSGETVLIQLNRGMRSTLRFPVWQEFTFEWRVSSCSLVYMWPADGKSNLYQINPESGESLTLTDHPGGVLDYSITQDNEEIYYSYVDENGASMIMALDLQSRTTVPVVVCNNALCANPQLSAVGDLLAYEVIFQESGTLPGIRIVDLPDGSDINLGTPGEHLENPLWSPAGWLSTYNRTQKGYQFWNPETDDTRFFTNETGGYGTWSGDGRYFLASEILFVGDTLAPRHLQLYDLVEDTVQDLSVGDFLEDLNPSFSPSGLAFAFSRKSLNPTDWTPGRQLWVMDPETGQSSPLTNDGDYQHTSFAWHPDGERLAYVRYNQASLSELPEIWIIDTTNGEALRLIINGFAPGWIP